LGEVSKAEGITEIPSGVKIPLSREQKRLWFLQQLNPKNPFYNYSELYRLKGDLNIKAFEKSIRFIEAKHDILKSNYTVEEGKPIVSHQENPESEFLYFNVSENEENAETKADEIVQKLSSTVFNLSTGALMKSAIIKVAENNHLFVIVMHHMITDKWSMRVFRKDLAEFYSTIINGENPKVNKPGIQYANYAYWQQNKKIDNSHLNYWKNKLTGSIPILDLPLDRPKKSQPTYQGAFHKQVYSDKIAARFFDLCKNLEATPYVVMLSIYYVLLEKYTNQQDILVGTPITKRDDEVLENLIGFFNDTLVLRTQLELGLNFKELVGKVKQTTLEAFANKEVSFDTLVKELNPERSLNIHPFFQVMFLYHQVPETPVLDSNIEISYEPYDMGVSKFDLTLYISEDKGGLMSLMEYETDLFDTQTIERMHLHFQIILEQVINSPDILISEISVETEREKEVYKRLENPSQKIESPYTSIHKIIEEKAKQNPEDIAVVYTDEKLTYEQLDLQAKKVASFLMKKGINKNDVVGLCIERSPKMIVGLLGILKAGATYLPLDPSYPEDRINYILKHSKSKALLVASTLENSFENTATENLDIDEALNNSVDTISQEFSENIKTDLAYIIYTSGSTGKPKGVPVSHGNIINSTEARTNFYNTDPKSFLLMSSIAFDSSKAGIFWSLCTGGTLVISENKLEQDLEKLTTVIKNHKVSHTLMLPSLYQTIISYADLDKLISLKAVIVAGEACNKNLIETHFKKLPNVNLYNEYGPTEGTVWCLAHKIKKTDLQRNSIPIGKPVANTEIYVLDSNLKKVPFGTVGELCIGGRNLTSGYYKDHVKTSEVFIDSPFKPSGKIYKTGDLVKFNDDETLQFLGRKDQQVKVRGYRIELDEIEQQIYKDSNVKVAAVNVENKEGINIENLNEINENELSEILIKNMEVNELNELFESVEGLNKEEVDLILNNL